MASFSLIKIVGNNKYGIPPCQGGNRRNNAPLAQGGANGHLDDIMKKNQHEDCGETDFSS
jgi:hypothetical protein